MLQTVFVVVKYDYADLIDIKAFESSASADKYIADQPKQRQTFYHQEEVNVLK